MASTIIAPKPASLNPTAPRMPPAKNRKTSDAWTLSFRAVRAHNGFSHIVAHYVPITQLSELDCHIRGHSPCKAVGHRRNDARHMRGVLLYCQKSPGVRRAGDEGENVGQVAVGGVTSRVSG